MAKETVHGQTAVAIIGTATGPQSINGKGAGQAVGVRGDGWRRSKARFNATVNGIHKAVGGVGVQGEAEKGSGIMRIGKHGVAYAAKQTKVLLAP